MPKYLTNSERVEAAETLTAALAIAQRAGLQLDRKLPILPPRYRDYLIAPSAHLLLVPSMTIDGSDRRDVSAAMRLVRCDALIIRISRPSLGGKRILVDIGLDGAECVWHQEYRAHVLESSLHFLPCEGGGGSAFKLTSHGLVVSREADLLQNTLVADMEGLT